MRVSNNKSAIHDGKPLIFERVAAYVLIVSLLQRATRKRLTTRERGQGGAEGAGSPRSRRTEAAGRTGAPRTPDRAGRRAEARQGGHILFRKNAAPLKRRLFCETVPLFVNRLRVPYHLIGYVSKVDMWRTHALSKMSFTGCIRTCVRVQCSIKGRGCQTPPKNRCIPILSICVA